MVWDLPKVALVVQQSSVLPFLHKQAILQNSNCLAVLLRTPAYSRDTKPALRRQNMSSLLGLLLVLSLATLLLSKEYYIATNGSSCYNTTCYTLDQLAQADLNDGDNLTLIFEPGEHTLTRLLSIRKFTQARMIGQHASVINFHGNSSIDLSDIDQLSIEGLTFTKGHVKSNLALPTELLRISHTHSLSISSCYFTDLDTGRQVVMQSGERFAVSENIVSVWSVMSAVIKNTTFEDNNGTAVSIRKTGTISIENSTFIGNHGSLGGAVYIASEHAAINNGIYNSNERSIVSSKVSIDNSVITGNIARFGGGIYMDSGNASITCSVLKGNYASAGGGIHVDSGSAFIVNSNLTGNTADDVGISVSSRSRGNAYLMTNAHLTGSNAVKDGGGGISVALGSVSISNCSITDNIAGLGGGIFVSGMGGNASITNSVLTGNNAKWDGGGICVDYGNASITNSILNGNTARRGGGIYVYLNSVLITYSILAGNTAEEGGGINVDSGGAIITNSNLTANSGSAIYSSQSKQVKIIGSSIMSNEGAPALHVEQSILSFEGYNSIHNNTLGSLYALDSQVHFNGSSLLACNHAKSGGAIQAIQSQLYFSSATTINDNTASQYGGGIFLRESSLFINSSAVKITHNTATEGGAIYAYQSTIEFGDTGHKIPNMITNNVANGSGGGIYAVASTIKLTGKCLIVRIESNTAKQNGGGFYLQQNSKLYLEKHESSGNLNYIITLNVSNNDALLGGGIYVNDSTSGEGACTSTGKDFLGECFIQTIRLYNSQRPAHMVMHNTFVLGNTAKQAGSAIYGGLLDRCTPSPNAEVNDTQNGLEYMRKTVKLPADEQSVSSDPLQVKLCNGSSSNVSARKGQAFQLRVKALDQVGNPVNATIHSSVVTESGVGRLKEGQLEQSISSECTEIEYNVFSENSSAQVEIYAKGPCNNLGLSRLTLTVTFLNCICPLGFHPRDSKIECKCVCDDQLQAAKCFPEEETFLVNNTLWIGVNNCNQTGYLVHNCPLDYCIDQPVNISLNSSQQIDRQCAYNRHGVLCGECENGLSLVFASSKCKHCSNIFLLLLIPFAVAGITLVVFILWLNITIATGTTYGLIFYANILAANKAIFLPFTAPNFLTVFVSWVNLDFGIETCFYDGMNSQAKVLLQLGFPAYLFLLIFLVIILSRYINSFAKLLSNRNPVAALCTLLILSYSKLLRLIIAALQFTYLDCPESPQGMVWLYDANVDYFSSSHIPRFVAAAVILTACVLFTTLLFFGQWFPHCSKCKLMKWTKNTKYIGFMDAFHAPFTPKHRYWPGLLLFALIAHNLATSMAPDTSVPILSAGSVSVGLIAYKFRVYKHWINNALETLFLLNVVLFALGTYHFTIANSNNGRQLILAYISMSIAFVLFAAITGYHFYKYVLKKTKIWNNQMQLSSINFHINRNYQTLPETDNQADAEFPTDMDVYTYGRGPREETDPDKYITPPIITPASRLDQLREPALDILAPVTEDDYRQAPPIPQTESHIVPAVTSTVVKID